MLACRCSFGSFLFGWISDNHGRRTCLVLSNVTTAAAAAAAALSRNSEAYMLMRALAGFTSAGMPIAAMLLGTEAVGSSWRGRAGVMSQMLFNGACELCSCLGLTWKDV